MSWRGKILDIFLTKLNSIVNPKFQNIYIRAMFAFGVLLVAPKILNILAKFELITNDFIIKIEFIESSSTLLSILGVGLILLSSWLFYNERKMSHELTILTQSEDEDLLINYYVCENFEELTEINDGDLSSFPVKNAMILRNSVLNSLNEVILLHPEKYRHANAYGNTYNSVDDYLKTYPEASKPNRNDGKFSYFQVVRTPDKTELESLKDKDGLLKLMLSHNINYPISIVGGYEDGCAGIDLQEEYIYRKIWCSFICLTNNTEKSLQLDSLIGSKIDSDTFHEFSAVEPNLKDVRIPNVMLKPEQSIIVPIAILLPPLYSFKRKELAPPTGGGFGERVQIVKNESIYLDNTEDCLVYGDRFDFRHVKYRKAGKLIKTEFREFDLTNMFTFDLHWQCGSCPHLFFTGKNTTYQRELLAHCQGSLGTDFFNIPENVNHAVIAEIEDEITFIKHISVDGKTIIKDLILNKGEFFRFPIYQGAKVIISGHYEPYKVTFERLPQGIKRNELIGGFLNQYH